MERSSVNIPKVNTFFLLPNIIEYIRLTLLVFMFFYANNPLVFALFYFTCAHLDCIDGYLARRLKQESNLGKILDYTIDRISLALLGTILISFYPNYWQFFASILLLDIASHFCQLYSTLFLNFKSHKALSKAQGRLLQLYYSNRIVLYSAIFSHDLWYGCFYFYHFYPQNIFVKLLMIICFPGFLFKIIIHILQIITALRLVAR